MQNFDSSPCPEQYRRTELMLGRSGLERLRSSCVFIAGLGAVGCYVVEALARAGIGRFQLVDFDTIQESNINRQLLATHQTVGRLKTDAARERILSICPDAKVETLPLLINDASVNLLFAENTSYPSDFDGIHSLLDNRFSSRPDFVVDAIDSLTPKVALIMSALKQGLPLLSSMGAALRFDASLVSVGRLTDVVNDPLARQLRKRLRRVGVNTDDVPCVYSPEPVREALRQGKSYFERVEPARPIDPESTEPPQGRPRNTLGSLPTIVGLFGLRIAHEIIMKIAKENDRNEE